MERLRFTLGRLGPIAFGLIVAVLVAGLYLVPHFLAAPPAPPAPPPGRPEAAPPAAAPQPKPPMDTVPASPPRLERAPRPELAASWMDWIFYQLAFMGGMTALTCLALIGLLVWQSHARQARDVVEQP